MNQMRSVLVLVTYKKTVIFTWLGLKLRAAIVTYYIFIAVSASVWQ